MANDTEQKGFQYDQENEEVIPLLSEEKGIRNRKVNPKAIKSANPAKPKKRLFKQPTIGFKMPKFVVLQSGEIVDLEVRLLGSVDCPITYGVRYLDVAAILCGWGNAQAIGASPLVEYTSQNPWASVLLYLGFIGFAGYRTHDLYQQKKAAFTNRQATHTRLNKALTTTKWDQEQADAKVDEEQKHVAKKNAAQKAIEETDTIGEAVFRLANENMIHYIDAINRALKEILVNDTLTPKIYKEFKLECYDKKRDKTRLINFDDLKINCTFKDPNDENLTQLEKLQLEKFRRPNPIVYAFTTLYDFVATSSFTYWIMWILAVIAIGAYASVAIAGMPFELAFGLSFAAGLIPLAVKLYNWNHFREGKSAEHAHLRERAELDAPDLICRAVRKAELDQLKSELEQTAGSPSVTQDKPIYDNSFYANKTANVAVAGAVSLITNLVLIQYVAWILSDVAKSFFSAAFNAFIGGWVMSPIMTVIAIGFAIREMVNTNRNIKIQTLAYLGENQPAQTISSPENNAAPVPFATKFVNVLKNLRKKYNEEPALVVAYGTMKANLEAKIAALDPEASKRRPLLKTLLNGVPKLDEKISKWSTGYNLFDWATTGIFLGRLLLTTAAIYIMPILVTTAFFSAGATIGLLVLCGVVMATAQLIKSKQQFHLRRQMTAANGIKTMKPLLEVVELAAKESATLKLRNRQQAGLDGVRPPAIVVERLNPIIENNLRSDSISAAASASSSIDSASPLTPTEVDTEIELAPLLPNKKAVVLSMFGKNGNELPSRNDESNTEDQPQKTAVASCSRGNNS